MMSGCSLPFVVAAAPRNTPIKSEIVGRAETHRQTRIYLSSSTNHTNTTTRISTSASRRNERALTRIRKLPRAKYIRESSMAVRGLGTVCLSVAAVLLGTIGVEACSCGERTLCETFEFSTVVMQVSPFSRSNSTNDTTAFNELITYGVDVLAVYKGESGVDYGDNNTFLTESGGSFCGVFLELDTEYLIDFSRDEDDGLLHASSCGLARVWSSVDAVDLADLESGCGTTNSTTTMTDDDGGASNGAGGTTNSTTTMADDDEGASSGAGGTTNGTSTDDSNSASDEEETPVDEQAGNSSLRRVSSGSFGAMVACFTSFMALGFGV